MFPTQLEKGRKRESEGLKIREGDTNREKVI